ncbi:hypothetical protein P261_01024 [Lachnospiraceae bacterium TWA4]|nr:hypothetical protein P261_01024 [Lachnospiraceae bacterium TWA4]
MGLFFNYETSASIGKRATGFARYRELLERDFSKFLVINLLTLVGFLPFAFGVFSSIIFSSSLLLIPASIVGGIFVGPTLCGLYDAIFRSLRDAPNDWWSNYKKAWKQNFKSSIVPGIVLCLLIGLYIFMFMLFFWANTAPSIGTILVYILSICLFLMIITVFWPQLVLFSQTNKQRLINCLLFSVRYLWKMLLVTILQVFYWGLIVLFLPWSIVLLPLTGFWFILFLVNFILYSAFDESFKIEEQIAKYFPDQVPIYEDDEAWLKRKQEENNEEIKK